MVTRYQPAKKQQLYLCICRLNPAAPPIAISGEELHLQHRAWIQGLADRDLLEASGPARDESGTTHLGSIFILRAASLDEARRMIAADPQVREGQRLPEVIPWQRMWFEG
jgi:uncharacterized protein YciI